MISLIGNIGQHPHVKCSSRNLPNTCLVVTNIKFGLYSQDAMVREPAIVGLEVDLGRHLGTQAKRAFCFCGSVGTARFTQLKNSYFLCDTSDEHCRIKVVCEKHKENPLYKVVFFGPCSRIHP